jgi:hypothetical protein
MMGMGLLLIMRYRPKGILPEKIEIKWSYEIYNFRCSNCLVYVYSR